MFPRALFTANPYMRGTQIYASTPADYSAKILATSPIAHWALDETSGSTAADDSGAGLNGTYGAAVTLNGDTFVDGAPAAVFPGGSLTSHVALYSAGLLSAFDPNECTIMIWGKPTSAHWASSAYGFMMHLRGTSGNPIIEILKNNAASTLLWYTQGASGNEQRTEVVTPTPGWTCLALTRSLSDDVMRAYRNGTQVGADETGLVSGAASLVANNTGLGVFGLDNSGLRWIGSLAHGTIWDRALTPEEVAALAVVS